MHLCIEPQALGNRARRRHPTCNCMIVQQWQLVVLYNSELYDVEVILLLQKFIFLFCVLIHVIFVTPAS